MPYLSNLIGKPVADVDGERIGRLADLIASLRGKMPHPEIVALVVKRSGSTLLVPFSDVAVFIAPAIPLARRLQDIVAYEPREQSLYLARDVLDKQIIDTNGMRVVRVNDLELVRVNYPFYVANVDVGGLGLLRCLGLAKIVQWLASRFGRELRSSTISWDDVELLLGDQPMRLRVPSDKIAELHPADLAEIISDLSYSESSRLLESLDVKTVADRWKRSSRTFRPAWSR